MGRILDMAFSSVNGTAKCVSSNTREMPYVNVKQCFRAIFNIREMEFVSFVTWSKISFWMNFRQRNIDFCMSTWIYTSNSIRFSSSVKAKTTFSRIIEFFSLDEWFSCVFHYSFLNGSYFLNFDTNFVNLYACKCNVYVWRVWMVHNCHSCMCMCVETLITASKMDRNREKESEHNLDVHIDRQRNDFDECKCI